MMREQEQYRRANVGNRLLEPRIDKFNVIGDNDLHPSLKFGAVLVQEQEELAHSAPDLHRLARQFGSPHRARADNEPAMVDRASESLERAGSVA
jgi:hypothetical protein